MMIKKRKTKGFTLIEVFMVMSIIVLFSSIALASLNRGRAKARDQVRKDTLLEIKYALDAYFEKYGSYPNTGGTAYWYTSEPGGIWYMENGPNNNGNWIPQKTVGLPQIVPEFLKTLPQDPDHNKKVCGDGAGGPIKPSYMYVSDGMHYLLGSHCAAETGYRQNDPFAVDTDPYHRWPYMWIICSDRVACTW